MDEAQVRTLAAVREAGLPMTLHAGEAARIATHPITAPWRAGVSLRVHTDNRLMSGVTPTSEAAALLRETRSPRPTCAP